MHIIQRGNNRGPCFFADDDYQFYLHHLGLLAREYECAVHAYVLMTNHVHLLLTPRKADGASLLMKHLGQRYVQYVNRIYRRSGTLWEGRFRSSLVQTETYFLRCQRYIECNPVRAQMVQHPAQYRWSSFGANGEGKASTLITARAEYLALGGDAMSRRANYLELFRSELDEVELKEIRSAANGSYALGAERFLKEIERMTGRRATAGKPGRPALERRIDEIRQHEMF
jgi:putative transposase